MNKIAKYFSLIIIVTIGIGYTLFLYATRFDYLSDGRLTAKGVAHVYGIRKTTSAISNLDGGLYYDKEKSSKGRVVDSDDIRKLVSKEVFKDLEGTKFERITSMEPIDQSVRDSIVVLEITPNKRLEMRIKYYHFLQLAFDLKTNQGLYTYIPSLRDISEEDKGSNKMSAFFLKTLATSDTLEVIGSVDEHYSDIETLTGNIVFSVDKISNREGQELYFFPFNPEYETKIANIRITIIITSIMAIIFSLSIVLKWKGNG